MNIDFNTARRVAQLVPSSAYGVACAKPIAVASDVAVIGSLADERPRP